MSEAFDLLIVEIFGPHNLECKDISLPREQPCIPKADNGCVSKIIVRSLIQERNYDWNFPNDVPCDTLTYSYQRIIPILQTSLDYYSVEDPVSVDSLTSSDDSSASTVIFLKSSKEVDVDEVISRDQEVSNLSLLQALPDHHYYSSTNAKDNLANSYQESRYVEDYREQYLLNRADAFHIPKPSLDNFDKVCELDLTHGKRETANKSVNVGHESAKSSTTAKTPVSFSTAYSSSNQGNFITTMAFI